MDNIPVKISENYRPVLLLYKMPQAMQHKLALQSNHFLIHPQFNYNFQLEDILLTKLPKWRHLRQCERDARSYRKRNHERTRQKCEEEAQKQRLDAVSYPSADDLSSCSSEENVSEKLHQPPVNTYFCSQSASSLISDTDFHTILQPTIAFQPLKLHQISNAKIDLSANMGNSSCSQSFNYRDFEQSSTLFDDIELRTINDIDILAQVLKQSTNLKDDAGCKNGNSIQFSETVIEKKSTCSTILTSTCTPCRKPHLARWVARTKKSKSVSNILKTFKGDLHVSQNSISSNRSDDLHISPTSELNLNNYEKAYIRRRNTFS